MFIPGKYIELVRHRANIVDVISPYAGLVLNGQNYTSSCPFPDHIDNDPSFVVNLEKGIYKCFGCGNGGNMFTFLMEYDNISFGEAVKKVALSVGMDFPFEVEGSNERDKLFDILRSAAYNFHQTWAENKDKYNYFVTRGIPESTIKKYGLGYCSGYLKKAIQAYDKSLLLESGLFYDDEKRGSVNDRLYNHYTFPIVNISGKVIAFSAKRLNSEVKYKNTPNTIIFKKEYNLYGLFQAKSEIKRRGYVVITEGNFDVLTMASNGYGNTVGMCGTALTLNHCLSLKKLTENVILFLDNDDAGIRAIIKSFVQLWSAGFQNIYVAIPPEGMDPDDLVRKHKDMANEILGKPKRILDYFIKKNMKDKEREDCIHFIKVLVGKINDKDRKSLFVEFCSKRLDIPRNLLYTAKDLSSKIRVKEGYHIKSNEILLLSAILRADKIIKEDKDFINGFKFDDIEVHKVFTGIMAKYDSVEFPLFEQPSLLYDNVTPMGSKILAKVISHAEVMEYSIAMALGTIRKENKSIELNKLLAELKTKERGKEDCTELVSKINELI